MASPDNRFEAGIESFQPLTEDEQAELASSIRELLQEGPWKSVEFEHQATGLVIAFDFDAKRGIYSCMIIPEGTGEESAPSVILESTGPRMAVYTRIVKTGTEHQSLDDDPGRVRRGDVIGLRDFLEHRDQYDYLDSVDKD